MENSKECNEDIIQPSIESIIEYNLQYIGCMINDIHLISEIQSYPLKADNSDEILKLYKQIQSVENSIIRLQLLGVLRSSFGTKDVNTVIDQQA